MAQHNCLQSPLGLTTDDLNTPTSTTSLNISPSDLTPVLPALSKLSLSDIHPALRQNFTVMDNDDMYYTNSSSPDAPPPDLHSKLQKPTAEVSRTTAVKHYYAAHAASRKLQQVLGFQGPEPFPKPLDVPGNLVERFLAGVQEGEDTAGEKGARAPLMPLQNGLVAKRNVLGVIREESSVSMQNAFLQVPTNRMAHASVTNGHGHPARSTSLDGFPQGSLAEPGHVSYQQPGPFSELGEFRQTSVPMMLFPSPRVEQDPTWGSIESTQGGTGQSDGGKTHAQKPLTGSRPAPTVPSNNTDTTTTQQIPNSKKRSAPSEDTFSPPMVRTRILDNTTGLPVLPSTQEILWRARFPGNTYALLTILLEWSVLSERIFAQLSEAQKINAAFRYRVKPPVHTELISVAFYDTSTTPHKEIRYVGPGDVAEISYNEVDVFAFPEDEGANEWRDKKNGRVAAAKKALGLGGALDANNKKKNILPTQDDDTPIRGDRWAYILLQDHADPENCNEPPPHMLVAWHVSALTAKSDCLYTIYPDESSPSSPAGTMPPPPVPGPKRLNPLHHITATLRHPRTIYQNLRGTNTAPMPEPADTPEQRDGALTLRREVMAFGKAGRVPLVEGYRVDVGKWRGWMDAVGRGAGKVVVWKENE